MVPDILSYVLPGLLPLFFPFHKWLSTLLPKLSSGKKINPVLSVCFKNSFDALLPIE